MSIGFICFFEQIEKEFEKEMRCGVSYVAFFGVEFHIFAIHCDF